jgi:hypothetical protein
MSRYLLTCACGKPVAVEIGQAGGQVRCECGARLDVPTLRRLRHLPVEPVAAPPASRTWQPRYGLVAALVALAFVLGAACCGVWLSEPRIERVDLEQAYQVALQRIDNMTPAEWWNLWNYRYRPELERVFNVYQKRLLPPQIQEQAKKRRVERALLILAAVSAAAAATVALWPVNQTRRQGDRETRK